MSRDIEIDPRETVPVARIDRAEAVERVPAGHRQPVECRGRTYQLRPSEHLALQQSGHSASSTRGIFRSFSMSGNRTNASQDLRSLTTKD